MFVFVRWPGDVQACWGCVCCSSLGWTHAGLAQPEAGGTCPALLYHSCNNLLTVTDGGGWQGVSTIVGLLCTPKYTMLVLQSQMHPHSGRQSRQLQSAAGSYHTSNANWTYPLPDDLAGPTRTNNAWQRCLQKLMPKVNSSSGTAGPTTAACSCHCLLRLLHCGTRVGARPTANNNAQPCCFAGTAQVMCSSAFCYCCRLPAALSSCHS